MIPRGGTLTGWGDKKRTPRVPKRHIKCHGYSTYPDSPRRLRDRRSPFHTHQYLVTSLARSLSLPLSRTHHPLNQRHMTPRTFTHTAAHKVRICRILRRHARPRDAPDRADLGSAIRGREAASSPPAPPSTCFLKRGSQLHSRCSSPSSRRSPSWLRTCSRCADSAASQSALHCRPAWFTAATCEFL